MGSFFLSLKGGRGGRDWGRWTDRTRKGERSAAGRQRCDGGSGGEDSDREKVIESKHTHARTHLCARTQRNFFFSSLGDSRAAAAAAGKGGGKRRRRRETERGREERERVSVFYE